MSATSLLYAYDRRSSIQLSADIPDSAVNGKLERKAPMALWRAMVYGGRYIEELPWVLSEYGYVWCDNEEQAYVWWLRSRAALSAQHRSETRP